MSTAIKLPEQFLTGSGPLEPTLVPELGIYVMVTKSGLRWKSEEKEFEELKQAYIDYYHEWPPFPDLFPIPQVPCCQHLVWRGNPPIQWSFDTRQATYPCTNVIAGWVHQGKLPEYYPHDSIAPWATKCYTHLTPTERRVIDTCEETVICPKPWWVSVLSWKAYSRFYSCIIKLHPGERGEFGTMLCDDYVHNTPMQGPYATREEAVAQAKEGIRW